MVWWDDLWLNEAFATWMEERIIDAVAAGLGRRPGTACAAAATPCASTAWRRRAACASRIESSHDVRNAFDAITYQKGQALLEMFESWLGDERFKGAVRRYIGSREWRNAAF